MEGFDGADALVDALPADPAPVLTDLPTDLCVRIARALDLGALAAFMMSCRTVAALQDLRICLAGYWRERCEELCAVAMTIDSLRRIKLPGVDFAQFLLSCYRPPRGLVPSFVQRCPIHLQGAAHQGVTSGSVYLLAHLVRIGLVSFTDITVSRPHQVHPKAARALVDAGRQAGTLQYIDLGAACADIRAGGLLEDADAIWIAATLPSHLEHGGLIQLALAKNRIGDEGGLALAASLASGHAPGLRTLNLQHNRVGDAAGVALASALGSVPCLRYCFLQHNRLEDQTLHVFASMLRPRCEADAGTRYLAPWMKHLEVSANFFAEATAAALRAACARRMSGAEPGCHAKLRLGAKPLPKHHGPSGHSIRYSEFGARVLGR